MQIPSSLKAKPQKHIMFGIKYFKLNIILKQRKADARMLVACFETKY
jgi:hypothetical protein